MRDNIIILFSLSVILFSCVKNGNKKKVLPPNTGKHNEIVLVVDQNLWEGKKGDIIKEIFEKEIAGLPQSEKFFNLIQISPNEFSRFFQSHKNIMFVSSGVKDSYSKNKWAESQIVIYLNSEANEIDFAKSCKKTFNFLDRKELEYIKYNYEKGHYKKARLHIKEQFGFELFLPTEYTVSLKQQGLFISDFHSFNEKQDLLKYIIVYEFNPTNYELQREIIVRTDSILKQHILGDLEGTYVQIDNRIKLIEDNGIYRGMWILKNGFMGGPIIIKTRYIEDKVVVSLGMVFNPNENKRSFVRTFEAIL
tara:strand:- start:1700 stop:2620 length:921 start_codon:yes stop_codon:yes gene_type:complete